MSITIEMLREELKTREHWAPSLVLLRYMEEAAQQDAEYAQKLDRWLSGGRSTVFLRDELCEPLRAVPQVVQAGSEFNPGTEWANLWMPLDTAAHRLKIGASEITERRELQKIPGFGAF